MRKDGSGRLYLRGELRSGVSGNTWLATGIPADDVCGSANIDAR